MKQLSKSIESQERLENKKKLTATITLRTTPEIKAYLKSKAKSCKMSLSKYIHSLVCGYEPKAAMTAEQEKMLEGLIGARNDIKNFSNALNYRSPADRKRLFGDDNFMKDWMAAVDIERLQVNDIIYSFTNPNSL